MLLIVTVIIVLLFIILKIFSKLSIGRCTSPVCLIGKTALITGANSGIGYQTALILASRGCRVIIADKDNCDISKLNIIKETGNSNIITKQFNLASLKSVKSLADDINRTEERLDILINNAGTAGLGNSYTEDGLHIGMQVNHFGPFLLTHLLIKLMKKSQSARIIFTSSCLAYASYLTLENLNAPSKGPSTIASEFLTYCNSKLCSVITANQLAIKLKGSGITVNSVYPGIVDTSIFKRATTQNQDSTNIKYVLLYLYSYLVKPLAKTPFEGAQTTVHVALARELENVSGRFFVDCKPFRVPPISSNGYLSKTIWKASESYVRLSPEEKL